jgi:hypothetical protein
VDEVVVDMVEYVELVVDKVVELELVVVEIVEIVDELEDEVVDTVE